MRSQFAPTVTLFAASVLTLTLALITVLLALNQPWLGLQLSALPNLDAVNIDSTSDDGPSSTLPIPSRLSTLAGSDGIRIPLTAVDIIEEPDTLETYKEIREFRQRQSAIMAIITQQRVELGVHRDGTTQYLWVEPKSSRPISDLPPSFWIQLFVGLAGFWIGAWVWSLRRGEHVSAFFALTGAGLMLSALSASIYSTRELAIDGELFRVLSAINHAGALLFGAALIGLFLSYPHRLVSPRYTLFPAAILALWFLLNALEIPYSPAIGFHLSISMAMLAILLCVALQYRSTRGNPRARAALGWLGLGVVLGAGGFVLTIIVPNLFGIQTVFSQGYAFLFFLVIYVGLAFGVARYKLFELDKWAFRILFYATGALLLIVLDAALIFAVSVERLPAFGLSLLTIALFYLPLRDSLFRRMQRFRQPKGTALFQRVMDVALSPDSTAQSAQWQRLLREVFDPLEIQPGNNGKEVALDEDGVVMHIPMIMSIPSLQLEYAHGGRKLFSTDDMALARDLTIMLNSGIRSRRAYENGVAEERRRIARDMHDNIGIQLLGALHSHENERKNALIREAISDLRDIINNASGQGGLPLEEVLADLRAEVGSHLSAVGIALDWKVNVDGSLLITHQAVHVLRAIIREATSNVIKYSHASRMQIALSQQQEHLLLHLNDDGKGIHAGHITSGNGLGNMQERISDLHGCFEIDYGPPGVRINATLPLEVIVRGT